MAIMDAEIRRCPDCGLRYPWHTGQPARESCPRCGGKTERAAAWQLTPDQPFAPAPPPQRTIGLVLDNVRSAWNVGALFRTADGLGISRIWLGGITPPPTHPKARKTALGAERTILWETNQDTATILASLRNTGWSIWALEQASPAAPLEATQPPDGPLALVVGNEISGVGTDLFAYCDQLVYIPMQGVKRSLNVEVAAAIALWYLLHA